jgi:DNA-binding FadR family transcriptional regulator
MSHGRLSPARGSPQRIREFVVKGAADGKLAPGDKLPTEREFVSRFSVPRNAVRRILAELEAEGLVTRHVGRGTYLRGPAADPAVAIALSSVHSTSPGELMEARLKIEPALAELIVTNATTADFERMETCLDKAEKAATLDGFELWDAALHQALAQATHNQFVIRILEMVTAVREQSEWGKLKDRIVTPERRIRYQQEHREIINALKTRDAERSRAAILAHLQHARRNLFGF